MPKHKERGIVQAIVTIMLWIKFPSWEQSVLKIITDDSDKISHFGNFWKDIVHFLLNHWEFISLIILCESVYAIITGKNLIYVFLKELKKAISNIEKKVRD
jgi:hypothetical protein